MPMLKLIASTNPVTSFLIFNGNSNGMDWPLFAMLARCKATQNSGNIKDPDLLVSDNSQRLDNWTADKPDFIKMDFAVPPAMEFSPFGTLFLKIVSNLSWSLAVMNESLIGGNSKSFC